jgi:malonyl CoA-acyl carrier protein transacylase
MIVFGMDKRGVWHITREASADGVSRETPVAIVCRKRKRSVVYSGEAESVDLFLSSCKALVNVTPRMCVKCLDIDRRRINAKR